MHKNNLTKSNKPKSKFAKKSQTRKSTPSKSRNAEQKTPLNGSANQKTSPKNSTWTDDFASKLNQAIQWRNEGKFEEAAHLLEGTVIEYPDQAPVFWYLGWLYRDLGNKVSAIENFRKATQLSPKAERASLGLFHALWDTDQHHEALEEMKRFQVLTNWSCRDYIKILAEIDEKWTHSVPGKKKAKTKK